MTMTLIYDTETTGIPHFQLPSADPSQPHITQISAALIDKDRNIIQQMNEYILPVEWEVPAEVETLTGLTTEFLKQRGIPIEMAISNLLSMSHNADTVVGHNVLFDQRMVRIELKRMGRGEDADAWKAKNVYDTCRESRALINLAKSKAPTLAEAYAYFYGPTDVELHNAETDRNLTMEVYYALLDKRPRFDKYAHLRVKD